MAKIEEKKKIVETIRQQLEASNLVVFTDYRSLNVREITDLRNKLRAPGVKCQVVKNTMLRFALEQCGYENLVFDIVGPNAVIFSEEDPVGPAKAVFEFAKTNKKLQIKGGILEGQMVAAERIKDLSELPPREVLLAQVVGTMQAPMAGLVRVLNGNLTGLARALDQIREQKEAS